MSVRENARAKIGEVLARDVSEIDDQVELNSLVSSSFILVELVIELQEEFDVRFHQEDLRPIITAGQLLDLIEQRLAGNVAD